MMEPFPNCRRREFWFGIQILLPGFDSLPLEFSSIPAQGNGVWFPEKFLWKSWWGLVVEGFLGMWRSWDNEIPCWSRDCWDLGLKVQGLVLPGRIGCVLSSIPIPALRFHPASTAKS